MVVRNVTTIELYEKRRAQHWRYDRGVAGNLREVFGPRWPLQSSLPVVVYDVDVGLGGCACACTWTAGLALRLPSAAGGAGDSRVHCAAHRTST